VQFILVSSRCRIWDISGHSKASPLGGALFPRTWGRRSGLQGPHQNPFALPVLLYLLPFLGLFQGPVLVDLFHLLLA
jgi:hypothetical protein